MHNKVIRLNKPTAVGVAVLELSKLSMYKFHYGYVKKKYGDRARLCMTDTDSLAYSIKTDDIYKDMVGEIELFDTSNYPEEHFLYSAKNKKVIGKMKDECQGRVLTEFVGLRPKMYSLQIGTAEKHTAKGVSGAARRDLTHQDYLDCVLEVRGQQKGKACRISTKSHKLGSYIINKVSLCCFDDKGYCEDGVNSLAHGHRDIKSKQTC